MQILRGSAQGSGVCSLSSLTALSVPTSSFSLSFSSHHFQQLLLVAVLFACCVDGSLCVQILRVRYETPSEWRGLIKAQQETLRVENFSPQVIANAYQRGEEAGNKPRVVVQVRVGRLDGMEFMRWMRWCFCRNTVAECWVSFVVLACCIRVYSSSSKGLQQWLQNRSSMMLTGAQKKTMCQESARRNMKQRQQTVVNNMMTERRGSMPLLADERLVTACTGLGSVARRRGRSDQPNTKHRLTNHFSPDS